MGRRIGVPWCLPPGRIKRVRALLGRRLTTSLRVSSSPARLKGFSNICQELTLVQLTQILSISFCPRLDVLKTGIMKEEERRKLKEVVNILAIAKISKVKSLQSIRSVWHDGCGKNQF